MDTQYFADPHLAELHAAGAAMAKSAFMSVDRSRPLTRDELRSIYDSLEPLGYLGGLVPRSDGGAGMRAEEFAALLEGVAEAAPYLSNHSVQRELAEEGTQAVKDRWLPPLLTGTAIGTIAMTEPQGGSDLGRLRTRLTQDGDGYLLSGQKLWAVHTMTADVAIVLAESPDGEHVRVVVDLDDESVRRQQIPTSGLQFLTFGLLEFRRTRVSADDILADPGTHATEIMLATDRALVAVQATSIAQRAIHTAVKQLSTRSVRGRVVTSRDVIRRQIGQMSAAVEAARVFAFHALRFIDDDQHGIAALAAGAKAHAAEVCTRVCTEAIELCAAEGLVAGGEALQLRDDLMMLATGHGTSLVSAIQYGEFIIERSQIRR